jgi:hypothetical protein
MAVYAIGDLQGCYDPFRRLLDELDFEPSKDTRPRQSWPQVTENTAFRS